MHRKLTLGTLVAALAFVPALAFAAPTTPVATSTPVASTTPPANASSTMIADVNIYSAALLYQNGRSFKVTFNLNNGIGAQEGVRYGIGLVPSATNTPAVFVDEKVYPAVLSMPAHSSKQITATYTAPLSVTGTYDLVLDVQNQNGLPLAGGTLTKVSIPPSNGAAGVYTFPASCYVTVDASTTKYTLLQGVDIKPNETLNLHCPVHNVSKTPWVVTPAYTTFYRTLYGKQVPQEGGDAKAFSVAGNATTTVSLALPKATTPQSYDVAVSFVSQGKTVSNTFPVHYVIDGPSATIQTLSLDQTAYKKGDTAIASFVWTPSADGFPGARISSPSPSATTYTLSLTNSAGTSCIASSTEHGTLPQNPQSPITKLSLPIVAQCTNPHLSLSLVDASSTVLVARSFTATSSASAGSSTSAWYVVLLAVAVLAVILLIIALMRRYNVSQSSTTTTLSLLIVLIGIAGFLASPGQAEAASFSTWGYRTGLHSITFTRVPNLYTYTANFAPGFSGGVNAGGAIPVTGNIITSLCANELFSRDRGYLLSKTGTWVNTTNVDYAQLVGTGLWPGYPTAMIANGAPTAAAHSYDGFYYSYGRTVAGGATFYAPYSPGWKQIRVTGTGDFMAPQYNSSPISMFVGHSCGRGCGFSGHNVTYPAGSIIVGSYRTSASNSGGLYFQVCGSNQRWNGSSCVSVIPPCPSGKYYNTTLRSCVSNLYGQSCTSGNNVCGDHSTGTYGPNGVCGASTPSNTLCTCTSGPNACGKHTTGFDNAAGTCAANPPPTSVCCSAGNFWNTAINACSPVCGANATLNSSGNACVCKPGGFVPSGANSCACPKYESKVGSVCQDNAPSVSFSASPTQVYRGGSSKVTWSTDPAVTPVAQTSCGLAPGSTGGGTGFNPAGRPNGTYNLNNLTATTSLSIVCSYKGQQSPPKNVMIKVLQPNMTLTTTPDKVNSSGGTSQVSWDASNVTSCSLSKNGQSWNPAGTSLTPNPLSTHIVKGAVSITVSSNTTVTLTCNGSSVTKTIDVAGKYSNF